MEGRVRKTSNSRGRSRFFLVLAGALVMGNGVWSMYLVGKLAYHLHATVGFFLLYGVTVTIFIILFLSWVVMFFERHALEKLAYQDNTTGLPNRNEMNRFFDTHMGTEGIGVLFLDLDQFKVINDTLGHNVGDLLVEQVGIRLSQFVSDDQKAFRIGGDEFLFIVKYCDLRRAEQLAAQILHSIKKEYRFNENEIYVTGSIGISIGKILESDRSILLKTADTAMFKAKRLGKNQYCVYNDEMSSRGN